MATVATFLGVVGTAVAIEVLTHAAERFGESLRQNLSTRNLNMTTLQPSEIEIRAEENIRKWIDAEHSQKRLTKANIAGNVGPYVVIARQTGAGGSSIARLVGQQLGWDVLDKEIIDYMAERFGTPRSLIDIVDEKHSSWMGDIFNSWIDGKGFSSVTYVHRLKQLFLLAAHHGKVVIVGRGARFILPHEGGISVRILAPLDYRVAQIAVERGISEKEARRFVEQADKNQEAFIQENFRHKASDPLGYDLVINVENRTPQDAADLITDAANRWIKKSGVTVP